MQTSAWSRRVSQIGRVALPGLLIAIILFGGGSRADIASLVLLRPIVAAACVLALLRKDRDSLEQQTPVLAGFAIVSLFIAVQLIPLSPGLWQGLPGREAVAQLDLLAGLGSVSRPFSLVPGATWNALYALIVPLSIILTGAGRDSVELSRMLPVVIAIGIASGVLGLAQVIAGPDSATYLYRITNSGMAVGLFSNRNHQAIFLAAIIPMLAVYASEPVKVIEHARARLWSCGMIGLFLVPLILATGSRAGLVLGAAGIGAAFILYSSPQPLKTIRRGAPTIRWRIPVAVGGSVIAGLLILLVLRSQGFTRLLSQAPEDEVRLKVWGPILDMGWKYFPWGSGVGSFVEVYRVHEPDANLSQQYLNHAHNELLEVWLTAGVPGLALVAIGLALLLAATVRVFSRSAGDARRTRLRRLGAVIAWMLLAGSVADYPLRTPSLAAIFALALLWMRAPSPARESAGKSA